jgi:hypothetical protein
MYNGYIESTNEIKSMIKSVLSFSSAECNEFDLFNEDNIRIGYYIEHFVHPETSEKLDSPVFEVYYDCADDEEDFQESAIYDDEEEFFDFIDNQIY